MSDVSDAFIFAYGAVASVVVSVGFAALFWAAAEDGKAQKESDARARVKAAESKSSDVAIDS